MKVKKDLSAKERLMIVIKKSRPLPWRMYVSICCIIFCVMVLCGKVPDVYGAESPNELNMKDIQVRVTVAGDVQISDNVRKLANKIGYDALFEGVSSYWADSDCVMLNVSGPALRTNVENYKSTRERNEESDYIRPAAVRGFKEAGIDLLSFANDDAYNYGTTGINTTIELMDENEVDYIGIASNASEPFYRTVEYSVNSLLGEMESKQISIISINDEVRDKSTVSTNKAGIVSSSINTLYTDIYEMAQISEYTVAYVHFSDEESNKVTNEQRTVAQAMIDAGADLVIGSNATLKSAEEYHNGLIIYGLGTIVSDDYFSTSLDGVLLDFVVDNNNEVAVYLTPTRMWNGQPCIIDNKFYQKRIHSILTNGLEKGSYSIGEDGVVCIPLNK